MWDERKKISRGSDSKVEKLSKDSLDLIPSPSHFVKIQIMHSAHNSQQPYDKMHQGH